MKNLNSQAQNEISQAKWSVSFSNRSDSLKGLEILKDIFSLYSSSYYLASDKTFVLDSLEHVENFRSYLEEDGVVAVYKQLESN